MIAFFIMSILNRFAGSVAGGEGYLEVIAAGVGVKVEEFADYVKAVDEAALHGFGIDFVEGYTALGDDGLVPIMGADEGEGDTFEPAAQSAALVAVYLVEAFVVFNMQLFQCERNKLGRKP